MKKQAPPPSEDLLPEVLKILVPSAYLNYFELHGVKNKPECWELELREKDTLIPTTLSGKMIVADGFCNPISILSHSFSLKKILLVVHRRRWKEAGSDTHYSNEYDLHPQGAKMTKEMASFFKIYH